MQAYCGDNCLSCSKIYKWIDHLKNGRTSVCDEERPGRPSTSRQNITMGHPFGIPTRIRLFCKVSLTFLSPSTNNAGLKVKVKVSPVLN
jgi:hypothetical protein